MKYFRSLIALAATAGGLGGYQLGSHRPQKVRLNGPGTAKSYFDRPGSGLLTREEIARRRGGNPKAPYSYA